MNKILILIIIFVIIILVFKLCKNINHFNNKNLCTLFHNSFINIHNYFEFNLKYIANIIRVTIKKINNYNSRAVLWVFAVTTQHLTIRVL